MELHRQRAADLHEKASSVTYSVGLHNDNVVGHLRTKIAERIRIINNWYGSYEITIIVEIVTTKNLSKIVPEESDRVD